MKRIGMGRNRIKDITYEQRTYQRNPDNSRQVESVRKEIAHWYVTLSKEQAELDRLLGLYRMLCEEYKQVDDYVEKRQAKADVDAMYVNYFFQREKVIEIMKHIRYLEALREEWERQSY